MTSIGIMIEGQENLSWQRFFRILTAVEDLGFESLFRSDHLAPLSAPEPRETLALWPSLTAAAMHTKRIRFGPMVIPMTFRHPSMVAKMAASVSQLSGGRLDLGLGAGWYPGEHRKFGIRYPKYDTRLEMLDEGVQVIKKLLSGEKDSFTGKHYQLDQAQNLPAASPPIIMGGKNDKTLQIIAHYADEWNCSYNNLTDFKKNAQSLDETCEKIGRDPKSLPRSIMIPFVIGKDARAIQNHIDGHRQTFATLPGDLNEWLGTGFIGGSPAQVVEQIGQFVEAGCSRFMLQQNALDDIESLELFAAEVLPHF